MIRAEKMNRLLSTAVLLACLTTTAWAWCTSDTDCDIYNPICDLQGYGCTRARCTTDNDCGRFHRCQVYSYIYDDYGNATGQCEPIYCYNNEMCPKAEHAECFNQRCNCESGYRRVKDRCESVIGTSCQWDWSCGNHMTYDYRHTTFGYHAYFYSCEKGKCGCNPNVWRELNGACVSSKGKACDLDSDCGFASNTTCVSGICTCKPGYLERSGTCVSVWDIECLSADDCGISFACNESKCTCPDGYGIKSMEKYICVKVLDTPCEELAVCEDPSLNIYMVKLRGNFYYGSQHYMSHSCDVENICACAPGFRRSTNGHACQPIYGSTCTSVEDCQGDSTIYSQAYTCSNDSSTCGCHPNYMVNMRERYTGTYHEYINMCLPKIGSYCAYSDVDGASCAYSDNPDYNLNYGYSPRLTCTSGVEEHGKCRQIIGSNCSEFGETCSLANAICDPTKVCACKPGYLQQGDTCVTALNNTICASSVDCSNISHAACDINMTFTCVCEEGYVEKKGICVLPSSVESGNCNVVASELPDLYRRSPTYKLARGEVPIRDDLLLEGWYDIGGTNTVVTGSGLTSGLCGTKYPIVLKDDLTASEKSNLAAGLIVSKTMRVKGLDAFGVSKEIAVEVKICGDRTLLYLKPAPVAFSAYCIDTRRPSHAAGNSTSRCAKLRQEMRFKNEYDPYKETYVNVPYLMFKCLPMDENRCHDNYYYNDYENDGVFFTINWYVSGRHCKRSGPYQKSELYKTHLTENQVIDECGQKTVGFDLQCSFEWSEALFGERGTPIFSDSAYVGLTSWVTTITPDKGGFLISWLTDTPIGCKTDSSNTNRSCSIEWDLESGGICPTTKSSADHVLCGANGNGTTKAGFDYYGKMPQHYDIHFSYSWGWDLNGIYQYNYTTYGVKVFVSDDEVHEVGSMFKASFGAVATGHAIWNGYKMPDIKFYLKDESLLDKNVSLVLKWDGGPVLEKTNEWNETTIFPIEEVGEFLLYQSTDFIVEIQIKTRTCNTTNKKVCVCAVTFRNGNEIYTEDTCDSVEMKGFLFIGKEEDGLLDYLYTYNPMIMGYSDIHNKIIVLNNGLHLRIDKNSHTRSLQITLTNDGHQKSFEKQPGIASFMFKQYRHSNGEFKTDSNGFMDSWRVTSSRSFSNPANHQSFAFADTYFKCHCPTESEVSQNHEISTDTNFEMYGYHHNQINHFTSTLKCSRQEECTITHSGTSTWSPLVLPDYVQVEDVSVLIDGGSIVCYFQPFVGKTHKVEWVSGKDADVSLYVHGMLTTGSAKYDIISNLFISSGDACNLEKIRCVVTVYEIDGVTAAGPSFYSHTFDLTEDLGSANISICVIDGHCYFENDHDPANTEYLCYPFIDPYRWIRDLTLDRVPGDICNQHQAICDKVPGGSYCSNVTDSCQCYPTFKQTPTSCDQIPCAVVSDCWQYTYSTNLACINSVCACAVVTELTTNGCVPKGLGSSCEEDMECSLQPHAVCGTTEPKMCVCGEHYNTIKGNCYPKGLGDTCNDDDVCKRVNHSACYNLHGTGSKCECDFGYSGNEFGLCESNGDIKIPDPYYGSPTSWCYENEQCSKSLWWSVCDRSMYWRCVRRTCSANDTNPDASCMSSLLSCNLTSGFCEPDLCSAKDQRNCWQENTECNAEQGYCDCSDGYSLWNGDCTAVLDRACEINEDCHSKKGRYECTDNACKCNPDKWVVENGLCVSYVDKHCSASKPCGKLSNTTCNTAGLCECEAGFVVRDGMCVSAYLSGCNNDLDCAAIAGMDCGYWAYYDGKWFDNWGNTDYNGICVCKPGYAVHDLACRKVLGSNCDNLKACGNSSHWSYSYHYFSWWGAWYVKNYYKHYHSAFFCDVNNVCECAPGYERNADGTDCIRVWGSRCTKDNDCGGSMFKCDITTGSTATGSTSPGTCGCANNYVQKTGNQNGNYWYWYYDYYGREEITCKPYIGLSCLSHGCPGNDTHCDVNNICRCNRGYEKNGVCANYLGSECKSDTPCQHVANAQCDSSTHVCACSDGYYDNGQDECLPLLGKDCSAHSYCGSDNYFCDSETNMCRCSTDRSELNGRCIMDTPCDADIPSLPDILRRSPSYVLSEREIVIRDDALPEGWYNIGHFMISTQSKIPIGGCGTKWQMYMTSSVSSLADGGEVIRKVRLVSRSAIQDEFPVTIRKCGSDHHVYIPKAPVAFAGFCLDTGVSSNPGRNSTGRWSQLTQDLDFTTSVPEINFVCDVLDDEHSNVPCRMCTSDVYYVNDDFYYTINWYINDHLCMSLGPFQRPELRKTYLTETLLRERCQQSLIGFKVQCSYEWSLTMFGPRSTPVTSNSIDTGVPAQFITVPTNGSGQTFISSTPIACTDGGLSNSSLSCLIEFPLKRSHTDTCPPITNPNDNHLCGARLIGVTQNGLQWFGSWESFYSTARYGSLYDYNEGTYVSTQHKRLVTQGSHRLEDRYMEEYCPTSAGLGTLWNGYILPTQKMIVSNTNTTNSTCSIRWSKDDKQPMLIKTKGKESWSIPIDLTGEFMLFRSLAYPVEVQIKTEKCESSLTVCVCALSFRDGNKIYTVGICDGIATQGFVWAASDEDLFLRYTETGSIRVLNGMDALVTIDYYLHSLTVEISDSGSVEGFTSLDGLCAFEDNTFRASTGGLMLSSDGFLKSWGIEPQTTSSLLEPKLIHTQYAYKETMYSCSCPLDSELISGEYAGVSKCTKENAYNVTHSGETWDGSLVPDFAIENVTLAFEFVKTPKGANAYERLSVCLFDGFDGFLYDIYWYADTTMIHKKSKQSLTTKDFNKVSFDTLMNAYSSSSKGVCAVNKLWRCAVSVLNNKGVEVLGASYSEPFEFITFKDKFVSMARGGEVDFHFTVNLPVVCLDGKECNIEVKVIDESDDYQCQDSTLAVKNERTCGDYIRGIQGFNNINNFQKERFMILTTKNNNKYSLRDAFAMTVFIESEGVVEPFWNDCYFEDKINVFVRDIDTFWKGVYCYTNNDPRLMTFDGQYYSMQLSGEFTLYQHHKYPIEVQIQTQPCWPGGSQTCTCGVTVRAGRDVYTVTHCEEMHLLEWIELADDVLEVYIEPGYMHKFYLPQGTIVEARYFISPWWSTMNVYVYPSPDDMNRVGGLCGTFNGNWQDDFLHSDGVSLTPSPANDWGFWWWWRWGGNPDNFSASWSVPEERSLMNAEYVASLESWNTNDKLCVCPLIVNKREKWCSRNEDKTCVDFIYKKRGKRIQKILRDERSVDTFQYREESDIRERLLKLSLRKKRSASRVKRQVDAPNPADLEADYITAQASCKAYLKENCGGDLAEEVSERNENQSSSCAEDKMFNLTATGPEESTCRNIQSTTMMIVDKDVEFQKENPEKALLVIASCPDNCNNQGNCSNGTCICNEHYDPESNCKLDLRDPPTIVDATGDGNCNPRDKACHYIRFTTRDGCSNRTVCSITLKQYKIDGSSTESVVTTVPANCPNNFDAYCPTTVQSRKRREAVDEIIAESYNVSLSNDNSSFSQPETVTVLDTTCVKIENGAAVIMDGYCLIENVCHGNFTDLDECHTCDPTVKRFSWILKDNYCDIGGVCYPSGNVSTISCISECNPTLDKYTWSQRDDVCSIDGQCFNDGDTNTSPEECLYCDRVKDQFSWSQEGGFCYIAGVCYADAAVNPTDACRYCNVSVDTATWQQNVNDSACELEQEEKDDNSVVIGVGAALGTGAAVALAIAIGFYIYKKMHVSKVVAARTTGTLFDTSKNKHFKFRVEPMRTDPVEQLPMSDYNMPSTSVDLNSARVPDNLYN